MGARYTHSCGGDWLERERRTYRRLRGRPEHVTSRAGVEVAQAGRREAHVGRHAREGLGEAVREGDVHERLPGPDGRGREVKHDQERRDEVPARLASHRRIQQVARALIVAHCAALVTLQLRAHAEDHEGTRKNAAPTGEPRGVLHALGIFLFRRTGRMFPVTRCTEPVKCRVKDGLVNCNGDNKVRPNFSPALHVHRPILPPPP